MGHALTPDVYDTVADVIWDRLDAHMYETIPPPQELKAMGL